MNIKKEVRLHLILSKMHNNLLLRNYLLASSHETEYLDHTIIADLF